jgi:beta-carotene hydroxylase
MVGQPGRGEASEMTTRRTEDQRALAAAKTYSGGIAWLTLLLGTAAPLAFAGLIWLTVSGNFSYWLAVPVLSYLIYMLYTPLHEAVHRNISGQQPGLGWLDDLVGTLVSVPLGISYTMHRAAHFAHHSKTNDPDLDPDMVFGSGRGRDVIFGALNIVVAEYAWYFRTAWPTAGRRERMLIVFELSLILASRLVPALAGFPLEVLLLGVLPNLFGVVLVACGFAWLVHFPHENRGRYKNTSTFVVDGWLHWPMAVVWLWQNYHAIHHLFPRVPFYRYHCVFAEIRDIMVARGAPIYVIGGKPDEGDGRLRIG